MTQRIVGVLSRPEFWLAGLVLWLLGSAGRSLGTPWAGAALTEALRWGAGIGLLLSLSCWRRSSQEVTKIAVLAVGALALLGVADGSGAEHGGMVGPYHDHQLYGSALLVLLPFAAALALTARENHWRLTGLAVLAAGTRCLALSQTRSAWAGGLTAAVVFGGLWVRQSRFPIRHGRTAALSAVVLLIGIAAAWLLTTTPAQRAPVIARAATVTNLDQDFSWQARLTAWAGARRLIAAHPLFGVGLGGYPQAQWAWTQVGRPLGTTTRPSLSEEAHSFYLQTTAETGLVGLALYLAALTAYTLRGLQRLRPPRRGLPTSRDALLMAALSALAGQAVDALASPSWQFAETSLFFWAALGLGGMTLRHGQEKLPTAPPVSRRRTFLAQTAAGAAFVTLTAEILPLGLLTPVEAYDATTIKANSVSLQASASSTTLGVPVTYQLTGLDNNGNPVNLTFDKNTIFSASNVNQPDNAFLRYLSKDTSRGVMVFLIPTGTNIPNGKVVKVQATFPSYLSAYSKNLSMTSS